MFHNKELIHSQKIYLFFKMFLSYYLPLTTEICKFIKYVTNTLYETHTLYNFSSKY